VRVAEDRRGVRVEVEDGGRGIPEPDRSRLFNAFFTTKIDGLGLGLPICRSIMDQHEGEIGCEHLASGTRFVFSVPIEKPLAISPPQRPDPPARLSHPAMGQTNSAAFNVR
jgi:signal transduction histidine kinase